MKPPPVGIADVIFATAIVACIVAPMVWHYFATCWGTCL